jgi:hypothetical protein
VLNGNLARLMFVAGGSEMVANESVHGEWTRHGPGGLRGFASMNYRDLRHSDASGVFERDYDPPGGTERLNTSSRLDVSGLSLVAGLGGSRQGVSALASFGFYVEAGSGEFDARDDFTSGQWLNGRVRGEGDVDYAGVGAAVHFDWDDTPLGRVYAEASLRTGRASTNYSGVFSFDDLSAVTSGQYSSLEIASDFKISGTYYGGHIGAGLVRKLKNGSDLDFYTKLFYTHLEGGSAVMSTGDPLTFDSAESLRWRTGLRYGFPVGVVRLYVGAAYEHEFDGESGGTTHGFRIAPLDAGGGTGIGEIGFTYQRDDLPWSAIVGLSGYTGQKEGVSARLALDWKF